MPSSSSPRTSVSTAGSISAQRREKKRRHDREAQRASRERTKQQVAHLEELVRTLQAANECPERLNELLSQVDKGREEIRRLKDALSRIHLMTIPDSGQTRTEKAEGGEQDKDHSPSPLDVFDHNTIHSNDSFLEDLISHETTEDPSLFDAQMRGSPSIFPALDLPDSGEYQFQTEDGDSLLKAFNPPTSLLKPLVTVITNESDPVVAIASKILTAPRVEGRWLVLAGTVLNHCLNTSEGLLTPRILDDDIAIRACVEGWEVVKRLYWLDAGWRWLRQLDENMYLHLSIPQRMAILRVQRLQYLVSICKLW
jgi:hypothetical protein